MRLLIGSPVRQRPDILRAHLDTLEAQDADVSADYLFIDDTENEESSNLLSGYETLPAPPPEAQAVYGKAEETTRWNEASFVRMAEMRQQLLRETTAGGYDALFMADSDLLLGPETLRSLLATGKPVASAVYWTSWQPGAPPLPQVWLRHPYNLSGRGLTEQQFLCSLRGRKLTRVYGLGGCTLIRRSAIERGAAYAPLLTGLPAGGMWRGEDRSFSIRCERAHIEMYADPWPRVHHIYRPSDADRIETILSDLYADSPNPLEWISATIIPLEEPALAGHEHHLRSRLSDPALLPDLKNALAEMSPGEERLIRASFPPWWSVYPGQTRSLSVKLIDAR